MFGHYRILSESPIACHAWIAGLAADVRLSQVALVTVTAGNVALQTDSVPHLHTAHATAYRIHNATDLMAKHDRQLHEARDVRHPPVNMHIGPAHAGGRDLDADLPGERRSEEHTSELQSP